MDKNKILISLFLFWSSFLISCSLFPNTVLFKQIKAIYQDKVLVSKLSISIVDDISPESEILNITKQNKNTVKIDYQASDIGQGIDSVQLWQRDLAHDWQLVENDSQPNSYFLLESLADDVYQWVTVAVDKAGNKQTDNHNQLANQQFNDWKFSTLQIDTQPPSIAFSIPDFQLTDSLVIPVELNIQGQELINLEVAQTNSFLVFEYKLETEAMADKVKFEVSVDGQIIYVDGAGEKDGWVGDSGWQQVTYLLRDRQSAIEILFSLINNDQDNYVPSLKIKDIGIVDDKTQFNELNIKFIAHDLGSGIKEKTEDDNITPDKLESKQFTAQDYALNAATFEPKF